jgi:hypothetical protein
MHHNRIFWAWDNIEAAIEDDISEQPLEGNDPSAVQLNRGGTMHVTNLGVFLIGHTPESAAEAKTSRTGSIPEDNLEPREEMALLLTSGFEVGFVYLN